MKCSNCGEFINPRTLSTVDPERLRLATQRWREGINSFSGNKVIEQALSELWASLVDGKYGE